MGEEKNRRTLTPINLDLELGTIRTLHTPALNCALVSWLRSQAGRTRGCISVSLSSQHQPDKRFAANDQEEQQQCCGKEQGRRVESEIRREHRLLQDDVVAP
jgi:hypothetical protein